MPMRRKTPLRPPQPPVAPPVEEVVPEADTLEQIAEALGEVYKQVALIARRLDSIDAKIVGGTAVVSPTTGRTRSVTLVKSGVRDDADA